MNQDYTKTQKLTISAICIALYLVVMLCTQSFAFGQYQVRPVDAIGGFFMGVLTSGVIAMGRRYGLGCWIVAVAVTLLPGLGVPVWLSRLLHIPYVVLVASLLVGQFISGITGMLLVRALEKADVANLCFRTNRSRN